MDCAYCGKKIGALRKLQDGEFCSTAHRKAYLKKQNDLALDFLLQNKPKSRPEPPPIEALPATPIEPQPLLILAEFVSESVGGALVVVALQRKSQPLYSEPVALLPACASAGRPRLCVSPFARVPLFVSTSLPRTEAAVLRHVAFAGERPRIRAGGVHPLWIEPAQQVQKERPRAGFIRFHPLRVQLEGKAARSSATARFPCTPKLSAVTFAPGPPAFHLSSPKRPCVEIRSRPATLLGLNVTNWRPHATEVNKPKTSIALRPCGFSSCEPVRATPPAALSLVSKVCGSAPAAEQERHWKRSATDLLRPFAAITLNACGFRSLPTMVEAPPSPISAAPCNPVKTASHCAAVHSPVLTSFPNFVLRSRTLDPAPPAPMPRPHASAVKLPTALSATASFVWKLHVDLGFQPNVCPIRPVFETREELASFDSPIAHFKMDFKVPLKARAFQLWDRTPRWSRRMAVILPLAAIAWAGIGRLSTSGSFRGSRDAMWVGINERAATELQDDFRLGLSRWTGSPGWAKSWSYDATGFARPGRLAWLSSSVPLTDYRVEFLAQIDKKAVGWVFRAADARNYYAAKLVESKRGPSPAFSIVRYVMVDGRERLRAQLPLPATATSKSMLRVRQEVRGTEFTTYLDGRIVDTWSDPTLTRGGVGFFADPGEAAYIRWIEVAHNDDFLGRLCSLVTSLKPR